MKRTKINELRKEVDNFVLIKGFIHEKIERGKINFLQLRDVTGICQIVIKGKSDLFKTPRESVIELTGTVKKANIRNEQITERTVEVEFKDYKILSKSDKNLPIQVVEGKNKADLSKRLDNRFIDLRNQSKAAIFKIQSTISMSFRKHFENEGFIEIQPPSIIRAASEGGAELYAIPYFEKEAFLAQSPQLYKQMMMGSGFEKVFSVTPVWRAEPHETTRHVNEARQMDIEVSYANVEIILKHLENVLTRIINDVNKNNEKELKILKIKLTKPEFYYITYTEALKVLKKNGISLNWGEDLTPESERKLCEILGSFVFITNWPIGIRAFYSAPNPKNSKECLAYDALLNGVEILSGAVRIHDPEILKKAIENKGLDVSQFSDYISAFKYGCPPHAGWSIGLERITMKLLNFNNIREATLFPRDRNRLTP